MRRPKPSQKSLTFGGHFKTSYDPPAKFCTTLPQNDVPHHTKFCKTNTENTTENTEQIGEDRFSYDGVCAGMPLQQYYKGTQHTKLYAHDTV